MGLALLLIGAVFAVIGYAPIGSSYATSLELIAVGGLMLAAGMFAMLFVSAKNIDASDVDEDARIRP
jgi:hypothetical protein